MINNLQLFLYKFNFKKKPLPITKPICMTIGLLSDTHGYLDDKVFLHFQDCDEVWHAGDWGGVEVANRLAAFKPLRGVYGNIDGRDIRDLYPKDLIFELEGFKIYMTHIGGYPSKYSLAAKEVIEKEMPNMFICGHSHILKVVSDKKYNAMLTINPGAAGRHGFQLVRTLIKFEIADKKIFNMKAIELGTKI